jgi:hypothetical protein
LASLFHIDLTQAAVGPALPGAIWPGFGYSTMASNSVSIPRILYINSYAYDGDVHEIRLDGGQWIDENLSANAVPFKPHGTATAFGYVTAADLIPRVIFLGQKQAANSDLDNDIHELRLEGGNWIHSNLSEIGGAAGQADSVPFPYNSPNDIPRIVYRGTDHHVHELRLESNSWIDVDLTKNAGGNGWPTPNCSCVPFGYVTPDSIPRVIYCDDSYPNYNVWELRLQNSEWINVNLCQIADAPPADGVNPTAYVTPDATARVLYLGHDSHAHELLLPVNQSIGWLHTDLTVSAKISGTSPPNPNSMLWGYVGPDSVPSVAYVGEDRHVHQFTFVNNQWIDDDLFSEVINPPLGGLEAGPLSVAFVNVLADGNPQIVFNGSDYHIHLLIQFWRFRVPSEVSVEAMKLRNRRPVLKR